VCVCVCFLNSDIHLVLFCCLLNMSIGHLNYFSFVFFWQLMVFKRHMYTHLSKSILSSMDITKRKRKEKSKHESKNTRSVKIMIGFEITVVYVCICMQRERERGCNETKCTMYTCLKVICLNDFLIIIISEQTKQKLFIFSCD